MEITYGMRISGDKQTMMRLLMVSSLLLLISGEKNMLHLQSLILMKIGLDLQLMVNILFMNQILKNKVGSDLITQYHKILLLNVINTLRDSGQLVINAQLKNGIQFIIKLFSMITSNIQPKLQLIQVMLLVCLVMEVKFFS